MPLCPAKVEKPPHTFSPFEMLRDTQGKGMVMSEIIFAPCMSPHESESRSEKAAFRFVASEMADALDKTLSTTSFEQRFNCLICWGPKLRMVYGSCQHRLCESCLYNEEGKRRPGMERCPLCCRDSFPEHKPDIPEDNVEAQLQLGVRSCVYGCGLEMWYWELSSHIKDCPLKLSCHSPKLTSKKKKTCNTEQLSKTKRQSRTPSSKSRRQTRDTTANESWLRSGKRKQTS